MTAHKQIKFLFYLLAIMIIATVMSSCKTQKQSFVSKSNTDSLYQAWRDSVAKETSEKESLHKKELEESKKANVVFKSFPCPVCPDAVIPKDCDKDSLVKRIRQLEGVTRQKENKIEFYENGALKSAQGEIESANYNYESAMTELETMREKYELQVHVNDSLKAELNKKTEVKTKQVTRSAGISWWPWILMLLVIAFIAGCIFWNSKGNALKQFFGKISIH